MRAGLLLIALLLGGPAAAIDATPPLENAELQARYEKLTEQLRCLVCQNQTIADSNAFLAADLRRQVRDMLEAGKSDAEIIDFMTARYGDFVLYNPPLKRSTWVLWAGPFLLLLTAVTALGVVVRRRARLPDAELDDEEAA